MAAKIQLLKENIINKIAAGEVVERPASVVKELVENSIDAGAAKVNVAIRAGGKQSIVVSDDGVGMGREDIGMCVHRHATNEPQSVYGIILKKYLELLSVRKTQCKSNIFF